MLQCAKPSDRGTGFGGEKSVAARCDVAGTLRKSEVTKDSGA